MLQARIRELEAELDAYRPGARYRPRLPAPEQQAGVWDGVDPPAPEE